MATRVYRRDGSSYDQGPSFETTRRARRETSLLDSLFGSPEEDQAALDASEDARWEIDSLEAPDLEAINLEGSEYVGDFVPSYLPEAASIEGLSPIEARGFDAATIDRSAFDSVSTDPRLRQAQMDALSQLQDVANQGGLTAMDRSRLAQIDSQEATADRGRREAILQNMRARGMGGSGNELLAQLQSAQAATDNANTQGLGVEAMAQQRALEAMAGACQLGGTIRGQDFGEQATVAEAQDALSKFNAANTQQSRQFFAGASNDMAQFNQGLEADRLKSNAGFQQQASGQRADMLARAGMNNQGLRQGVNDSRADARNRSKVYNANLPQQAFENRAKLGGMKAGAAGADAQMWDKLGDRKTKTKAGAWEGVTKGVGAIGAMMSDEREKKDVKPITSEDLEEFFSAVQPSTFRYKDESAKGAAQGERSGFMAQDVEDTTLGKTLVRKREDGTREYDPENFKGILLAALKEMGAGK